LTYVLVYDLAYVLVSIFLMMLLYVHPGMDVNMVMSYVIKLHYAVWVSCYYDSMWLCYHYVMMLCGWALNRMIIVNIVMSCIINLHYAVCCHVVMMFFS